ncbi:hypothetical protein JYU34_012659 [Plutella xylostella]|uniref:Uncharacterized protein n=1 Tax=Plutella xylostella TaxID=51655 RepID=A0ABQ7QBV4_PLUXY|nr:uncharacterized protein LOC119691429 [Plutella xylostella]KAG7302707.1 hypothetical protein JYU34_012659 [Plutella xylostella]
MAPSVSAVFTAAALLVFAGWCAGAPQGSVQGGVQGGAQVPPGAPHSTAPPGVGGVRKFSQYSRGRGYRDWRTRGDPTLINSLWRSRQPLGIRKQLGNAEVYIVLALLIGFLTVVVGCWLSDNCWSPEPEDILAGG